MVSGLHFLCLDCIQITSDGFEYYLSILEFNKHILKFKSCTLTLSNVFLATLNVYQYTEMNMPSKQASRLSNTCFRSFLVSSYSRLPSSSYSGSSLTFSSFFTITSFSTSLYVSPFSPSYLSINSNSSSITSSSFFTSGSSALIAFSSSNCSCLILSSSYISSCFSNAR